MAWIEFLIGVMGFIHKTGQASLRYQQEILENCCYLIYVIAQMISFSTPSSKLSKTFFNKPNALAMQYTLSKKHLQAYATPD